MWPFERDSFSLNIMPPTYIKVVESTDSLFPLIAKQNSKIHGCTTVSLTHHLLEYIVVKFGAITNKNLFYKMLQKFVYRFFFKKEINWSPNLIIPEVCTVSISVVCVYTRERMLQSSHSFLNSHWIVTGS